jgi:5-oxoprolinase (ATP-hydrolysing)
LRPSPSRCPKARCSRPRLSGGRRRRQCRDQPGVTDALFGAFGALGRQPGHHEQLHLRQRSLPVLRNHRRVVRAPGRVYGASAVQTHMTNSRLTDPEVLETRFPVLLEEFSIRPGSGGAAPSRPSALQAARRAVPAAMRSNGRTGASNRLAPPPPRPCGQATYSSSKPPVAAASALPIPLDNSPARGCCHRQGRGE